jgi:hypothetical protein
VKTALHLERLARLQAIRPPTRAPAEEALTLDQRHADIELLRDIWTQPAKRDPRQHAQAVTTEIAGKLANEAWTVVPRPSHTSVMKSRWIFDFKLGGNRFHFFLGVGYVDEMTERNVAKGMTRGTNFAIHLVPTTNSKRMKKKKKKKKIK